MEEYCVFCGANIPAGELWCQDCTPHVENLPPDKRRELEKLLANEQDRAKFRQDYERAKEAVAAAAQCIIEAIRHVADWLADMREA